MIRTRKSSLRLLTFPLVIVVGLGTAVSLALDIDLPIEWGVLVLGLVALCGIVFVRVSRMSLLPRLMILLYAMPFSTLVGYWFNKDYIWWSTGVPKAVELIKDRVLVDQMAMVGIVGLSGLIAGMLLVSPIRFKITRVRLDETISSLPIRKRTLSFSMFIVGLCVALFLSWLSAPAKDVFTASYASGGLGGIATAQLGFNASFFVSYILLILLYIDAESETARPRIKKFKLLGVLLVTGYIVVILNLLRGDRESLGLIVGFIALFLTGPISVSAFRRLRSVEWSRFRKLLLPAAIVFVVFLMWGSFRSLLTPKTRSNINLNYAVTYNLKYNTWTGVLLTNLGLAVQYHYGPMVYYYGKTYWDYLLSLPPGSLTKALGVSRPMDGQENPARWFPGISGGGVHIAVVPFKNFGIWGLFFVLGLYGFWIARLEKNNASLRFWPRILYGAIVTSSFFWFWYGDMNPIRAVMIALLLGILYQVLIRVRLSNVTNSAAHGLQQSQKEV